MDYRKTMGSITKLSLALGILSLLVSGMIIMLGLAKEDDTYVIMGAVSIIGSIFYILRFALGLMVLKGTAYIPAAVIGIIVLIGDVLDFIAAIVSFTPRIFMKLLYLACSVLYLVCIKGLKDEDELPVSPMQSYSNNTNKTSIEKEAEDFFK